MPDLTELQLEAGVLLELLLSSLCGLKPLEARIFAMRLEELACHSYPFALAQLEIEDALATRSLMLWLMAGVTRARTRLLPVSTCYCLVNGLPVC